VNRVTHEKHHIASLVKQRRNRYPRFPAPEGDEGGSAIGEWSENNCEKCGIFALYQYRIDDFVAG
jgi:hypothetical protein